MGLEVAGDGAGQLEAGEPEPPRVGEGGQEVDRPTVGQRDRLRPAEDHRLGGGPDGSADFDQPQATGQFAGDVDGDGVARGRLAVEGGGDGGGRVDHDQVAAVEGVAQPVEPGVDGLGLAHRHHQGDVVPAQAPGFGGLVGLAARVQDEGRHGRAPGLGQQGHGATATAEAA